MTAGVDLACGACLLFPAVQRFDSSPLHRLEDARVDVGLQLADQRDQVGPAANPTQPPAGHVEGLGERVKLEPNLLGAWNLEQAQRPVTVERDLRIRCVVAQHDPALAAEIHRSGQELPVRDRRSRVVRIVEPHQSRALRHLARDRVQVGQPVVLGLQGHRIGLGAGHQCTRDVHRVARVRSQHDVARIDERERHVADAVLGAERRQDLGLRIEPDIESIAVPVGDRAAQLGQAEVRRIAMVVGVRRGLLQDADDPLGRRQVGIADAKRDDIDPRALLLLDLAVDLGEEIWRYQAQSPGTRGLSCSQRI